MRDCSDSIAVVTSRYMPTAEDVPVPQMAKVDIAGKIVLMTFILAMYSGVESVDSDI